MSNTIRHSRGKKWWFRWGPENKASFIQDEMNNWAMNPTVRCPRRKPLDVYEAEVIAARAAYEAATFSVRLFCERPAFNHHYVRKHYYIIEDVPREKAEADAQEEWASRFRDGYCSETSRSTGFKQDAARKLRRDNNRYCNDIRIGRDVDHLAYPSRKESKYIVWSYW
jgi:hypothetical protein